MLRNISFLLLHNKSVIGIIAYKSVIGIIAIVVHFQNPSGDIGRKNTFVLCSLYLTEYNLNLFLLKFLPKPLLVESD